MHIWSKDERSVRFDVLDLDGQLLASLSGRWREVVPVVHKPGEGQPAAGEPVHSLVGDLPEELAERLADHVAFTSAKGRYRFDFAGRTFEGGALIRVEGRTVTLHGMSQPLASVSEDTRRAS